MKNSKLNKKSICTIIIPTHSAYLDVCDNFISILKKNWSDCEFPLVISVSGEDKSLSAYDCIYNGANASLLECVVNAVNKYSSNSYMILLGDAFICDKVDNQLIKKMVDFFITKKYSYCSLIPKKTNQKEIKINSLFRYINVRDRYSHSFISFLASGDFIKSEFDLKELKTDRDFELKYLNMANNELDSFYFDDHVILTKNVLSLRPGIEKGKWNRNVLKYLKKNNPEINFANRGTISLKWQLVLDVRNTITPYISDDFRRWAKKALSKSKEAKFDTTT
jgi:hypothetical protein